ncbi:g5269 [Coccomyxa viridis]|uniref:G5269 protein n=1 Tax=Coccomyxa viridis TaxID=1274662 RepID=A0ABP1FV82_9CHLO
MARAMPRRMSSWAALLAVLSASWTGLAQGMVQQEGPKTSPETCSIPASLSSFQGTFRCNSSVKIVRAGTEEEIAGILQQHNFVNENGSSHSWSQEQLNLGDSASVVTEINTTLALHNSLPASSG